jgi:hypothetical protein
MEGSFYECSCLQKCCLRSAMPGDLSVILVPRVVHKVNFICTYLFISSIIKFVTRVITLISMYGNVKLPKINAISDNYFVKSDKKLRSTKRTVLSSCSLLYDET